MTHVLPSKTPPRRLQPAHGMLSAAFIIALMALSACGDAPEPPASDEPFVAQETTSLCADKLVLDSSEIQPKLQGELFTLTVMESAPKPWNVGENNWSIQVEDNSGALRDDATLSLSPYMPDHGHGVSPPSYTGISQGNGLFQVATFNLIMPGYWELTVLVTAPGLGSNEIVFQICAEG